MVEKKRHEQGLMLGHCSLVFLAEQNSRLLLQASLMMGLLIKAMAAEYEVAKMH